MKKTPLVVLTNPNPLLRKRAREVDVAIIERLRDEGFLEKLLKTMIISDGVGIAATQVGVAYRIIVVLDGNTPRIFANPVITSRSLRSEVGIEGCLSVPGIVGTVRRAKSVVVRALDVDGKSIEKKCKGLVARIFQHEIDHLDGVLFIDRAIETVSSGVKVQ